MAIINREYIYAADSFKKPIIVNDEPAVGLRLLELLMMDPGSNPLKPDMGVGIRNYRYGIKSMSDLENRIKTQIKTYLPMYQVDKVSLVRTPDKILNVEIQVQGIVYRFDSGTTDNPISLEDLDNS